MAKTKLDVGVTVDFLNKDELAEELRKNIALATEQEHLRYKGTKYMRLPRLYATPANGTVVLGQAWTANGTGQVYTDQVISAAQGFVLSIRRLACNGLGTGSTPDLMNLYRNGTLSDAVWQLNGNSFAYTFGKTELLLLPGEQLIAASVGSMTSTQQITLSGDAVLVPAERIGALIQ